MKPLFNSEFPLDEILFQGRNKSYGAYALRHDADRILGKSFAYGLVFFGLLAAAPVVVNYLKEKPTLPPVAPDSGRRILVNVTPEQPPVVPPQTTAQAPKTYDSRLPTPVREIKNIEKPAPAANSSDASPGVADVAGNTVVTHYMPPAVGNSGAEIPAPPVVVPPAKVPDNAIITAVDVEAAFPGGIDAFRNKVSGNFDAASFEGSGETLKSMVTFVVEKDGSISAIKATGSDAEFNRSAEAAVKRIKGRWTPAKLNGEYVRSYFRFPVTMRFE